MIWCNSHRRPAQLCNKNRDGIMLPCQKIDLTDILEIEYWDDVDKKWIKDSKINDLAASMVK